MEKNSDIINFFKEMGESFILANLFFWFIIYSVYPLLFLFFSIKILFNKLVKKKHSKYFVQLKEEFSNFRSMQNRTEGAKKLITAFIFSPFSIMLIVNVFIGLRDFKGTGFLIVWLTIFLIIINLILDKIQKNKK